MDTHVLVWFRSGDRRLGPQAHFAIERAFQDQDAAVSAISFWEAGMQVQKGRITLNVDIHAWRRDVLDRGLMEIPVDGGIAARAALLGDMHGDPADRLIVATALEGHRLVTADERILGWPGHMSRLRATD